MYNLRLAWALKVLLFGLWQFVLVCGVLLCVLWWFVVFCGGLWCFVVFSATLTGERMITEYWHTCHIPPISLFSPAFDPPLPNGLNLPLLAFYYTIFWPQIFFMSTVVYGITVCHIDL